MWIPFDDSTHLPSLSTKNVRKNNTEDQRLGIIPEILKPEEEDRTTLRNVGIYSPKDKVPRTRRLEISKTRL